MIKKTFCFIFSLLLTLNCLSVFAEKNVLGENISYRTEGSVLYIEGKGDMALTYDYIPEIPWYNIRNDFDTVIIGEGITSIGEGAFSSFSNLKTIKFPETLKKISHSAFISCTSLESVTLPKRLTSIEGGAFAGCENLKSIVIPGSLDFISSDVFFNCFNLKITGISGSYAEKYASERGIPFDASLQASSEIMVKLNGEFLFFDQPPVIVDDRTLVPFRTIFESLGATVEWVSSERKVLAKRGDTEISLIIDSNILNKNGAETKIDAPAKIVNDRTMVPARAVSEALGAMVDWDSVTRTVIIKD